jgi:hypothetical protein
MQKLINRPNYFMPARVGPGLVFDVRKVTILILNLIYNGRELLMKVADNLFSEERPII